MRAAHQWAVELHRAITGKDQRTDAQNQASLKAVVDIRKEMREHDIAVLERRRQRYREQAEEFKTQGNRAQWTAFYHFEQAAGELMKALNAAKQE